MTTLMITHSHAEGTLIDGTSRGDGTAEILKAHRWRWGRTIASWYVPHSRDRQPKQPQINQTAAALRSAGYTVTITIDNTPRPAADIEATQEARQSERVAGLQAKADLRASQAAEATTRHTEAVHRLPAFGEPIKAGHHSERRHTRALERAWDQFGKTVEANRAADDAAAAVDAAARTTAARYAPVTVANRIQRLEADIRRTQRELDGHTRNVSGYVETFPPATGSHRDNLQVRQHQQRDQLNYWTNIRAEQVSSGVATAYDQTQIQPGDQVKISGHWWQVRRTNRATVTVESPSGLTSRAPYSHIKDHQPATD